jgi:adenylylsulfate kinase-like enzyme
VTLVSPYKDMRDAFKELIGNDMVEIYVHTNRKRQREQFKVENYQAPEEKFFDVDTTSESPIQSFTRLIHYLRETEKI